MKLAALSLGLLLSTSVSQAAKISIKQTRPGHSHKGSVPVPSHKRVSTASDNGDGDVDLSSVQDIVYIANVTVGGTDYSLQLDTGSSDLWVKGNTTPLPNSTQTSYTANISYGIGSVNGPISFTSVEFAGITVEEQAFIDVSHTDNPIVNYVDGILGLGFTTLSTVQVTLQNAGLSTGQSFLYNLFAQNKNEPNFIAFALQRTTEDTGDEVEGSFTIGEYEQEYAAVANRPKISTFPPSGPNRWTVLLDALLVGNKSVPLSSTVPNAPSGKSVIMLDSGTSNLYAPKEVCDAMYGDINGAQYSDILGQWIVPCDAEVDVALQFGSHLYPVHPIDITPVSASDSTTCVGSCIPQSLTVGAEQFDMLMGDSVMRSFYTVYDFGDYDSSGKMGNPFMQILPLVDPTAGSVEFHKVRGGTAHNVTYTAQDVPTVANSGSAAGTSSTVEASSDITSTLNKLQAYIPAMLAIMALNALVILVIAVAGIIYMCRRRSRARTRRNPGRATPVPLQRTSSFGMALPGPGGDPLGTYQPVSMALTEDTFVPPSPAFSKPGFGDSAMQMGDRPKSVA